MKRYSTLLLLTLPVAAFAADNAGPPPDPAIYFLGGCLLILLILTRLAWKTRRLLDASLPKAEVSSGYETGEFPLVGFPDSAHAGGRDS